MNTDLDGTNYYTRISINFSGYSCLDPTATETICVEGTYSPLGTTTCLNCSSGEYQDQQGQASCITCPEGSECTNTYSAPSTCPPGEHR